jgi:hypothetical protein
LDNHCEGWVDRTVQETCHECGNHSDSERRGRRQGPVHHQGPDCEARKEGRPSRAVSAVYAETSDPDRAHRSPLIELTGVRRQEQEWERAALDPLRSGRVWESVTEHIE